MFRGMVLCRFLCMMHCLDMMSTSDVSMVSGLFMRTFFMMFGCFNVVARGMLVVLGCFLMVFCTFVSSHVQVSFFRRDLSFLDIPRRLEKKVSKA